MSVSLLVFKGEEFNDSKSQVIAEMPVSFQNVWNETWEKAISECKVKTFVCGGIFSINAIPGVLTELDSIFNWVSNKGGKDLDLHIKAKADEHEKRKCNIDTTVWHAASGSGMREKQQGIRRIAGCVSCR